jgi:hypothetical protein
MGIFTSVTRALGFTTGTSRAGVRSAFSQGGLEKLVWSDLFDAAPTVISREEALTLPAVVKARAVLTGQVSRWPLVCRDATGAPVAVQPAWLQRTAGEVSPFHRMVLTVDDLIFMGWSLWGVERDAPSIEGTIVEAERIAPERWQMTADGEIRVDDEPVEEWQVLLIPGPQTGLLDFGARTMRGGIELERSWIKRARNPIPAINLQEVEDGRTTPEEAAETVTAWAKARDDDNGAVAFTPFGIKVEALGEINAQLFVEGRNYFRLDVAAFLNLQGSILDATTATASLTYTTQEGSRSEFASITLPYWMGAIEGRLSQDDVVPAGQSVRFDLSDAFAATPAVTGPITED